VDGSGKARVAAMQPGLAPEEIRRRLNEFLFNQAVCGKCDTGERNQSWLIFREFWIKLKA